MYDFILGVALFHVYQYIKSLDIPKDKAASSRKIPATLIEITAVCLLVVMVLLADKIPNVYRFGSYYWIPMALLILCFTQLFGEGIITKLLSLKPFVFLGKLSFSFYLIHHMMLRLVPATIRHVFKIDIDLFNPAVKFTMIFVVVLAASIIVFYFFEIPANKFVRKLLAGKNGRR
jgi:peptidoglycan/LPS O-acetylase OafA/YrhL